MGEYLAPEDTEAKPVLSEHHIHNLLTLAVGIKIVGPAGLRHTKTIDGLFFVVPLKNYIGPKVLRASAGICSAGRASVTSVQAQRQAAEAATAKVR